MARERLDTLEIMAFVRQWFRRINDHVPAEELLGLLAADGFELRFPEASLTDAAAFTEWYRAVTHRYFDQIHEVRQVAVIDDQPSGVVLGVWVNWKARSWDPAAAYSKSTDVDAFQRWDLVPGPDGKPRIRRYVVEQLVDN